ncbi:MGDG synthase family glycosyltransferase [Lentibacillus sp. Marseille-P4043]|uniref:MGDG synthase family glycosyltransferase n=1 Tax=Lentibacillus sp. Marseille-P4043 TaxID=2040293 RepID=UPI001F1E5E95|nr:glycosyltransferase [Lentibacillus sp. Marseille-P4043]
MNQRIAALFLPFMQIQTGHHHVADAIIHDLKKCEQKISCEKVDILSYSYGGIEKAVSSTYLTWIKLFPNVYNWLYQHAAYNRTIHSSRHVLYELLFTYFFKRLIQEKKPRIIFCTHALPSMIASRLKEKKQLDAIIINVYTDYFINRIWGLHGIDYHFVPTAMVKDYLVDQGIQADRIFITGIPVHSAFFRQGKERQMTRTITLLVTGGSLGVGAIARLLDKICEDCLRFHILCGKNKKLYEEIKRRSNPNVIPHSYITCRDEMNDLYEQVDAVVTKPGGVTISESLQKKKPIFVFNPLPGQEEINADQLQQQGLIIRSTLNDLEHQIISFFSNSNQREMYQQKMKAYHKNLVEESIYEIVDKLIAAHTN